MPSCVNHICPAPGNIAAAPAGGEGMGAAPANVAPLQMMWDGVVEKADGKFKGRTGGRTPDFNDKIMPDELRDIDTYFDNRAESEQNKQFGLKNFGSPKNIAKAWVPSLMERGFTSPLIKDITSDARQMWFTQDGIDYTATLTSGGGIGDISKAKMQQPPTTPPTISYNLADFNRNKKSDDDDDDDANN